MRLPSRRNAEGRKLSAYLDGELGQSEEIKLSDRLVFDADLRDRMNEFTQVDAMTAAALKAAPPRGTACVADKILGEVDQMEPIDDLKSGRSKLKPALCASAGILITVGIAFIGLRRRGLV